MTKTFSSALADVTEYAESIGMRVHYSSELDPFFKGDLDGLNIWLDEEMDDEERLFNLLHLIGHNVQWSADNELFLLGSVLHQNPNPVTLHKLYAYEWEANCYALYILQYLGYKSLSTWLYDMFKEDINYLVQFYKTGKKEKVLPEKRVPPVQLHPKAPPLPIFFITRRETRNGIVI